MKLKPLVGDDGALRGYAFYCPGCEHAHVFYTAGPVVWTFDGDLEYPTFAPSLLNTCDTHPDPKQRKCHLNLVGGRLYFHGDCSHGLVDKSVDLPDMPY